MDYKSITTNVEDFRFECGHFKVADTVPNRYHTN